MDLQYYINGSWVAGAPALDEPYLYQEVHTLAGRIFRLEEHIALLTRSATDLHLAKTPTIDFAKVIGELLARNRVPRGVSVIVRVWLGASGKVMVSIENISIYAGYTLRSIKPVAHIVTWEQPFGLYPTSSYRASVGLAKSVAAGKVVLQQLRDGQIIAADGCPLFVVRVKQIFTPAVAPLSVERGAVIEACRKAGFRIDETTVDADFIANADELFFADATGITAISRIGNQRYMDIYAERIAKQISN